MTEEWFRTAFGSEYLALYVHRDEAEAHLAAQLICRAARLQTGDLVLDAPCGAGRHARAFTKLGMRTCALDLNMELLQVALNASGEDDPAPQYVRGDLRSVPYATGSFRLVANLFSSFGYLATDEANSGVLRELARVCRTGGHVIIDFMNASHIERNLEARTERTAGSGSHVTEERWIAGSPPRINKRTVAINREGDKRVFFESVRLYNAGDLTAAFTQTGLELEERFGDYTGGPALDDAPRLILVGRKI